MRNYKEKPLNLISISEAARRADIVSQRFRRAIKILGIPVSRSGWNVMVEPKAVDAVKAAFSKGVIRPGRPKKKA